MLTARVLSASWSSKAALTSSPTPKVKMRVLAVFLVGDVLQDLVGVGLADGRLAVGEEDDGEGAARVARRAWPRAARRASLMAVPPVASRSSTHLRAALDVVGVGRLQARRCTC